MKHFDLLDISYWLLAGYGIINKTSKTEDVFDTLYHGCIDPFDIYDALEELDDKIGDELNIAIERETMDTAHPEAFIMLGKSLTEHGNLLFRLRLENAFSNLRVLLGWAGPKYDQAKYSLQISAASEWEAVCWSMTSFWNATRAEFLHNRAETLSQALIQKHRDET